MAEGSSEGGGMSVNDKLSEAVREVLMPDAEMNLSEQFLAEVDRGEHTREDSQTLAIKIAVAKRNIASRKAEIAALPSVNPPAKIGDKFKRLLGR